MAQVVCLTFNPFEENTYLLYDDTKECIIIDPGCYTEQEKRELTRTIETLQLRPVRLINTHCHLDHIFGNHFVATTYGLPLEIHRGELPVLERAPQAAAMYGVPFPEPSPAPGAFIEAGEVITFGNTQLEVLLTPGHSPASLSFFCRADRFLIAGDVLFQGSIGRTDLPGGDYNTLIRSIREQLLPLGDDVTAYPGHGPATTIGFERLHNPFLIA
ncbi:MAG TPA: MBL fold metallo-hydrolase [Saprospiraceae bacterium]|nr:MBL fold metallo-hydrolase [Saprospiraceae bacterium]HMP24188.1 MBL fold metallo-hydrolase [Saprospiraceae bacterium]